MVVIKDFEFSIVQRAKAVPEHEDISSDDTLDTRTVYAEIAEDSNFQLRIICGPRFKFGSYQALLVEVSIDGKAVNGKCFPRRNFAPSQSQTLTIHGPQKAAHKKTLLQNFLFTESETRLLRENESLDEAREEFKAQGTIRIDVSRAYGSFSKTSVDVAESAETRYPKDIVKEKGSTTCIKYANEERNIEFDTFDMSLAESPSATAIFKYRTKEVLRDLRIINTSTTYVYDGEPIVVSDDQSDDEALLPEHEPATIDNDI